MTINTRNQNSSLVLIIFQWKSNVEESKSRRRAAGEWLRLRGLSQPKTRTISLNKILEVIKKQKKNQN